MKTLLTAVLMLLIAVPLLAASNLPAGMPNTNYLPDITRINVDKARNAKDAPLTFTGTDTVTAGGGTSVTRWLQLGYARGSSLENNTIPQMFNPEIFTLIIELDTCAGGDSVGLGSALFQMCQDTTETDVQELYLDAADATFTVGEIVTGDVTGATGLIKSITTGVAGDEILFLHSVEGAFDGSEEVEGTTSGVTDDIDSQTALKHMTEVNNDGSGTFCVDGGLTNFASWVSEEITGIDDATNVQKYKFPLRVLDGGYIRFTYTGLVGAGAAGIGHDVKIHWELKCEN